MMAFGRDPSNPLSLLKETWSGENPLLHTAGKTVTEYLTELQSKLKQIHDFADQNSAQEQQRYVAQYNKRAVDKEFQVGQQVIVLIPDSTKKMVSRWQGPGTILEVKSPHSYLIELNQGQRRWLHANKLRPYHARVQEVLVNNCSIVYEADEEFGSLPVPDTSPRAEPSNTRGQDDENEAQKCHDNWCCSQCIRAVAYSHAICHRMPGSYNACGITVESSDSDLHCYQSLSDTLKVGLFILVSMVTITSGGTFSVFQFLSYSFSPQKRQTYQMGPWLAGIWYSLGI